MTSVTATELKKPSAILNRAEYRHERIAVTKHGREVAAVVPIEDARLLEKLEDILDAADAREALAEAQAHGTISLADLLAKHGR